MRGFSFIVVSFMFLPVQSTALEQSIGVLTVIHGDSKTSNTSKYFLNKNDESILLDMSNELQQSQPLQLWVNHKVKVFFTSEDSTEQGSKIQSITLLENLRSSNALIGSQPWAFILCKFNDKPAEPQNKQHFESFYSSTPGSADHYWRELSYNNINLIGSTVVDWVTLPSPQTTYIPTPGSGTNADLNLLFDDCTNAADPFIDYSDVGDGQNSFYGINLVFNDRLDSFAWGGGLFRTLDGVQKVWNTTWIPSDWLDDIGILFHEMGHGFGLPHANNSDQDDDPYDNPWDVMSSWYNYTSVDPNFGLLGNHINMFFKRKLGWVIDNEDGFVANTVTDQILDIDNTVNQSTQNYRYALLPLSDDSVYTIESRIKTGLYDSALPDDAVIIYNTKPFAQPWLIDKDIPPADFSDNEGVMWKVGETFLDTIDGYAIEILASTTNGFKIRIIGPNASDLIFTNSFE